MDFLDKLAYLLTPKSKKHHSEKEKSSQSGDISFDIKAEKPTVSKLEIKEKTNYAELHFKKPEKIYNDKFKKNNPFRLRFNIKERIDLDSILPFLDSKQEWVIWTYRNRYGIYTTVALYLMVLFGFSMISFEVGGIPQSEGILIKIEPDKEEVPEEEKKEEEAQADNNFDDDLSNLISDVNSVTKEDYQSNIAGDSPTKLKLRLADMQQDEIDRNEQRYSNRMSNIDKELEDERRMAKAQRDSLEQQKKDKALFSRKRGNVTVAFDLEGREAVYLEIPAYLCEGGGKVVIDMEVNPKGNVVSAVIRQTQGVTDACVKEMAVWATKLAEFSAKSDAPSPQKGTMTFIFKAQ